MKKKNSKAAKPMNARLRELIGTAAAIGFSVRGAFEQGVVLARAIGSKNKLALIEGGLEYKAGYVARYLGDIPAYAKKWHNLTPRLKFDAAKEIYARPYPESSKPNRRTAAEHKACRAADVSWTGCKAKAGIVSERAGKGGSRKPRTSTNPPKAVPVDLVKASPKLKDKAAANDYFATACAALLATVDKNAKHIAPQLSSAVTDFAKALRTAGIMPAAK